MKNTITLTILILCLGFAQASWRRLRHHNFKPQGYDLLQTQAQTETKTEATVTTSVMSETDCDPDCLYKYPYIEGDCSDKAETPAGPSQTTQPGQQSQPGQPQTPSQPQAPQQNEQLSGPAPAGPQATQGEASVPSSQGVPSFPPQNPGEVPAGSPFPVPEEDDSDETSSVYRYPFSDAGAGCAVVGENAEDAIVSTDAPETEVDWEELAPSQSQEGPQYQGGEQIPSEVPPTGPQDFPQDNQEEQGEQGFSIDVEQGYIVEQPPQFSGEDIQGPYVTEEGQSEEIVTGSEQEPTDVEQGYIVEQPSQIVGEDIQGPYVPEDVQQQPEETIVEGQQESTDVDQGYIVEEPSQIVVEDIQGPYVPEEVQPEEIITGSEPTDVEQGDIVEQPSQIVVEDIQGQYVPEEGQSEEIIISGQQECGGQGSESESGAPQGQEIPFEGQGVVASQPQTQPQPEVPAQQQPQAPAQPEFRQEVPVYNPYAGGDTVCSCICGAGGNTFPYSFKM